MFNDIQLFDGHMNDGLCAPVLFFHSRICQAVNKFHTQPWNDQRTARWHVGLYREVVGTVLLVIFFATLTHDRWQTCMRDAISTLMLNGCRGGAFFEQNFDWFDTTRPDRFAISWHLLPEHMEPFVAPRHIIHLLTDAHRRLNKWWLWDGEAHHSNVTRPEWWDVTRDTTKVRLLKYLQNLTNVWLR